MIHGRPVIDADSHKRENPIVFFDYIHEDCRAAADRLHPVASLPLQGPAEAGTRGRGGAQVSAGDSSAAPIAAVSDSPSDCPTRRVASIRSLRRSRLTASSAATSRT